jgi:hypothetical protein
MENELKKLLQDILLCIQNIEHYIAYSISNAGKIFYT